MRWSQSLIPTSRQAPPEAEAVSHRLLVRGGFIRRVSPGVFAWLPPGERVRRRVAKRIGEAMRAVGAMEVLLPTVRPLSSPGETGREERLGDDVLTAVDRQGRKCAVGAAGDAPAAEALGASVDSYRRLPLTVYQISVMFVDELRPRSGLLYAREYTAKEAYSFHVGLEGPGGLSEACMRMQEVYRRIFDGCGLEYEVVEAPSGGGVEGPSRAFVCPSRAGEDVYLTSESGYAARDECCMTGARRHSFDGDPTGELEKVHTPQCGSIEEVCRFFGERLGSKLKPEHMLKTLVYEAADRQSASSSRRARLVLAVVRGDHELCAPKLRAAVRQAHPETDEVRLASEGTLAASGGSFPIGFIGPHLARQSPCEMVVVDPDAAQGGRFWVTGGNEADYHVKHFDWRRDVLEERRVGREVRVLVADIRKALDGDPAPGGGVLRALRGIEIGRIEQAGSRLCDALHFRVHDERQQERSVQMGSYRIVLDRVIAAAVELHHDEDGIIWPAPIAPYDVVITPVKYEGRVREVADRLEAELSEAGLETLLDDRDARAGVKFKDADLIGIPVRLTVGERTLAEDAVELRMRDGSRGRGERIRVDEAVARCRTRLAADGT